MNPSQTQQAIDAALAQNWPQAIALNLNLIQENHEDVAALNRLGYAYLKSGAIEEAKMTYQKVLTFDKYNPIALKNLTWLQNVNKKDILQNHAASSSPTIFLEEPGKTKIVMLVNVAPPKILCNIMTAQQMQMVPRRHAIEIRDGNNLYIGVLPDDLSHRLLQFLQMGTTYDVYIRSISKSAVTVFIREMKRSKKHADLPSFIL